MADSPSSMNSSQSDSPCTGSDTGSEDMMSLSNSSVQVPKRLYQRLSGRRMSLFTQELATLVFGRETLAKAILTGKGKKGELKEQLEPEKTNAIIDAVRERFPNTEVTEIRALLRRKCNNESYKALSHNQIEEPEGAKRKRDEFSEWEDYGEEDGEKDEVRGYIDSQFLWDGDDLLRFWESQSKAFPLLAKVARMILCIPATSALSGRSAQPAGCSSPGETDSTPAQLIPFFFCTVPHVKCQCLHENSHMWYSL
ncbi:uncharacterized protein LOC127361024 [Dicentrarchus labrax]|uniref:uncharacterized protein LOC127361024 n=1 Tax=Dicentrarchus labrax TaxID=13489 RepID=UPI0021F56801|nr:uncharacterized protein LOC127361024 [Dicentrarchus labrax]